MELNNDQFVEGPFGSNACYEQKFEQDGKEMKTWLCFGSGMSSSTLLTEGSKLHKDLLNTLPELHKDLLYIDKNKRVWAPATITLPKQGMVFVDGTSKKAWQWAAVKAVEITAEDRENNKHYPKEQTHRMDMKNIKYFGQKEFMDALEVIGFYAVK